MISLILDQATVKCGFAILDHMGHTFNEMGILNGSLIEHGVIQATAGWPIEDRLQVISNDLNELVKVYQPAEMIVENTNFIRQRSGQTSYAMSAATYACHSVARKHKISFYKQMPNTIKKITVGYGHADKEDVIVAVCQHWSILRRDIIDDNHADALAGAYSWLKNCHIAREKVKK